MTDEERAVLTEKTRISLGLILAIFGLIIGPIAASFIWSRQVEARVSVIETVNEDLQKHRDDDEKIQGELMGLVHDINARLSRIEGGIEILKRRKRR
jgi:hypothetical protein